MTAFSIDLFSAKLLEEGYVTTLEAKYLGWSKQTLHDYSKLGLLKRVQHGVYTLPYFNINPLLLIQLRSNDIVFSHDTAAFHFKLTETKPKRVFITLPSNKTVPRTIKKQVVCHYVKPELHEIGVTSIRISANRCYINIHNRERTVCDFLRDCPDKKIILSIIKNYGIYMNWKIDRLTDIAKQMRLENKLDEYLDEYKEYF